MKIFEITGPRSIEKSREISGEVPSASSVDFRNMLDEEMNQGVALDSDAGMAAGKVAADSAVAPVVASSDLSAVHGDDMQGISEAVGLVLDKIANIAGNKNRDLKEIEGVINSLSSEAEGLRDKTSALPESHPLRRISDEFKVLAYVESIKWKRGDYV
ncbi:MAG: hypothetical protein AB2L11_12105 [Syntrophobacteraceae bacterium]